ncbi:MAG: DUF5011 domain-containing protein [Bacteroidetes bacterium]|nr:DUF5011 domain-containing protein [Bacteroidota bacterium]
MLMKTSITKLLLFLGVGALMTTNSSAQYCSSGSQYNTDSDIIDVELGNISNNTANAACADYTYFNTMSTNLTMGSSYQASITLGAAAGCGYDYYTKRAKIFIDYNGDQDFDDPGEGVGQTQYTSGTFTSTVNFQVPCGATAGKTRMRIVCIESSSITPCGSYYYGETEDYDVVLLAGPNPTADFSVPDTVYTNWVAYFTNSNQSGYTNRWYNSDLDPTLQTVNSTGTNYSYAFTTAGSYTLKLESENCQGTATKSKTIVVVDPTSTPDPNFVSSTNHYYYSGDPVEIEFYDLSLYGPTSWEWTITPDMNNGAPWFWSSGNQYSQNPKAFFYDIGTYEVCLTVTNSLGSSSPLCRSQYIVIEAPTGGSYVNIMGKNFSSSLDSGMIYDSGGPTANYKDNEYYDFKIDPCGANSVTLTFSAFDLETSWDYLKVYDGSDATAPLLGSFTGNTLPNSLTASSGRMYLLFTSDGNTNRPGFAASWTSTIPNNGPMMADFILPDTLWECSGGSDVVFENATTGVVPGQATYDWIVDYDSNITYPSNYCDYCGEENPKWTAPSLGYYKEYAIRMVASSCEGNDTIVKTLRVSPTTMLPTVDFKASNRKVSAGSVVTLTDMSVAGCSYEWTITPATGWSFENGSTSSDRIVEVKFSNPGSYHVKLSVTNDNGTSTEYKTNYIDVIDYCTPAVFIPSVSDVGINEVEIESIDNKTSSGVAPGYTNYSKDMAVNLTPGATYTLTVSRNTTVNSMTRQAWIDFNRDGEFKNSERVMFEQNASTNSYTATFTVPDYTTTVAGESRLRIGASLGNTVFNPCGPVQVGEFEDYGVMLVYDDLPPVITLNGNDTVYVEVNSSYTEDSATVIDNIQGDISSQVMITNSIDLTQPGIYFVHYDATDASGLKAVRQTRTVIVSTDLTAPVITLNNGSPYIHSVLVPWTDPGFTAIDNPGNRNVDSNVNISGMVDVNKIGDYTLSYRVSDINGNATEVFRVVQVRDLDAPVIDSVAKVFWQVGTPFVNPVSITDNFDQNVKVTMNGQVYVDKFGTYTVTFNAEDFSGNQAIPRTIEFEVGDSVRPVLSTLSGSDVVVVEVNDINYFEPPVTASDNYYPKVSLKRDDSQVNIYVLGDYQVIYTAEDGSHNTSTYVRTIRVVDTEKPTIIAPPMNIQRWTTGFDPMVDVTVLDNYYSPSWFVDNNAIEVVYSNVDVNYPGIYNVIYRATDSSGNASVLTTRIVNVWTPTGLENVNIDEMVNVYPNPSGGKFTVKLDAKLGTQVQLKVIDALGHIIATAGTENFSNGEARMDLSSVTAGVYMIQLTTDYGTTTKRIVINK